MNAAEFNRRVMSTQMDAHGKTVAAARAVLVDGESQYAACRNEGIGQAAVCRAVAKLRAVKLSGACSRCGQKLP